MKHAIRRLVWFGAVCGSLAQISASPPVIGVARSRGAFFIDNASVPGSATILEGTSVKTADAASDINLSNGERVTLGAASKATLHQDRVVLDNGFAEINGRSLFRVETHNLSIDTPESGARVRVAVSPENRVLVAAVGGDAEVHNLRGVLVARVYSGTALSLGSTNPDAVDLTGVVQEDHGNYFLTDDTTKVKVQLKGSNLKRLVGKHVHVTGSVESGEAAASGATEIVAVSSATVAGAAAAGTAAGTAGGAAAGAGVATGAGMSVGTIAIIGGAVAVGGTLGGLAATGVIGGSSSVSR